jgi:hypothetical protein
MEICLVVEVNVFLKKKNKNKEMSIYEYSLLRN